MGRTRAEATPGDRQPIPADWQRLNAVMCVFSRAVDLSPLQSAAMATWGKDQTPAGTARRQASFSVGVAAAAVLLMILSTACSSDSAGGGGASGSGAVAWADYEPGLQAKIDSMAVAKDCVGLQAEFNQIGATNLAMRNRYGHGNFEVLQYIDAKERAASCF